MTPAILSQPAAEALLAARLIASLGTLRGDGSIHIVPMWFLWDGQAVLLPTNGASAKAKNIARDPRATVMIHDSKGAFEVAGVSMSGRIETVAPPASRELNRHIHLRYITRRGLALKSVASALSADDVTLRFIPERASLWDMRALDAAGDLLRTGSFHALEPMLPAVPRHRPA